MSFSTARISRIAAAPVVLGSADDAHAFRVGDRLVIFRLEGGAAHLTYLALPASG